MTTNLTICQDIIRHALEQHRSGNKFALLSDSGIPSMFFPSMEALEEYWYAKPFDGFFEGFEANTSAPVRGSDWAYASEQAVELYDRLLTPIKTSFLIVAISRDDLDADIVETCEALKTALFEASMA